MNTVLITGTKGFTDKVQVTSQVERVPTGWQVITGSGRDVDRWVQTTARLCALPLKVVTTAWANHGPKCGCPSDATHCRLAGYRAAERMVEGASCVILFDDGADVAGRIILDLAHQKGLATRRQIRVVSMPGAMREELTARTCAECGKHGFSLPFRPPRTGTTRAVYCDECYGRVRLQRETWLDPFRGYIDSTEILLPDESQYRGEPLEYPSPVDWSEYDTWDQNDSEYRVKSTLRKLYYPETA